MGEQPNPWNLFQLQDAMSRHRGAQEFTSTAGFGTSMSAHRILGLKLVPRVGLFAQLKWYVSWV